MMVMELSFLYYAQLYDVHSTPTVAQVGFMDSQYVVPEDNKSTEVCISTSIPLDFDLDVFIVAMPLTASCKTCMSMIVNSIGLLINYIVYLANFQWVLILPC